MKIEISDMRIAIGDSNLKAFADIKFDDAFVVRGFSVLKGKSGLLVSAPKKAGKDGRWFDILLFKDEKMKADIETMVLGAYDQELNVVS